MTGPIPASLPPVSRLASDATQLFDAIVAKHGGAEVLGTAGLEIALALVRLHGDVRATSDGMNRVRLLEGISRLAALLPAPAVAAAAVSADGETFTSDGAIALHVVGRLTDEDMRVLADGLRAFSPSNECLAALVDQNTGLREQLSDVRLAFAQKDFVALNEALAHVPGPGVGRVDLVERLRRDLAALQAEVDGLREVRAGAVYGRRAPQEARERGGSPAGADYAPKSSDAPRTACGALTAIPAIEPRAPLQVGQGDGVDVFAFGGRLGAQFDNRG
jgi:hypothetical protein